MRSKAFTLIELLVSIGIVSLLIALLIPNIDRSLNKNQVANDVDLFRSKLESVRLLSGSTQQVDEPESKASELDEVGYYSMYIPAGSSLRSFYVVRLVDNLSATHPCTPSVIVSSSIGSSECLVEEVRLSRNVALTTNGGPHFIAFQVPTQKLRKITSTASSGGGWTAQPPIFDSSIFTLTDLTTNNLRAIVNVESYSGRVTVNYQEGSER